MRMVETCTACGVPLTVSRELNWEANGVVSLTASPRNRMVFFESETIDCIFRGIEELIGVPIERIVIESRSRETRRYVERAFPPEVRRIIDGSESDLEGRMAKMSPEERETLLATMKAITGRIIQIAKNYGYGEQTLSELWDQGADFPWRVQRVRDPYSVLFFVADNLGSVEAFEGIEMQAGYEKTGEDTYRSEIFPGGHALELRDRLKRRRYDFKPGDVHYERCPQCGIPMAVAGRKWDVEAGTIVDPGTGRRMAIFGPFSADAVFEDLESELGEAIPETVIEATRRYIRSAWNTENWNRDSLTFQQMIAVRGLGYLARFEGDRHGLEMLVQNACLHLPMVGTVKALVEMAYLVEASTCEWELADDGDLSIAVKVK